MCNQCVNPNLKDIQGYFMKTIFFYLITVGFLSLYGCSTTNNLVQDHEKKHSNETPFLINGKAPEPREVQIEAVATQDIILHSYIRCEGRWDDSCEGNHDLKAPANWQACLPLYQVANSDSNSGYSIDATDWYTNDPESPDRFRSFHLNIRGSGSHNPFDKVGFEIKLVNVGLRVIPATATNADRYAAGCMMPAHD